MKNGFTSPKNLKSITCSPKKTIHIGLVRTKTISLGSCFCVFVLGQGLEMGSAFLMVRLDVFLSLLTNRSKRGNAVTGRVRGDMVMMPIQSITRDVIRGFMINQVLPAIRAKWPREDVGNPIYIQQDNAPSHLKLDNPLFCEAAKQDGFDIRLICQPPNSPDFNILNLGFFRAIQTIQYKTNAKTIQDLVPAVQQVFIIPTKRNCSHIFLSFQQLISSLICVGIHGVLSTSSKSHFCDTTNCFNGSNEEERMQQLQDPSHE